MQSLDWVERNKLILILVIFFAGFLLRFYDLGGESFWLDEMASLDYSQKDLVSIVNPPFLDAMVHPLYYVVLHFWIGLFGTGEFAVRSLSAIFGSLSILALYKLGKYLFDVKIAIYGSFTLAVSFFHIYFSQEARMYSLLTLVTLVSVFFFLRSINERRLRFWGIYIIVSILMLYTHFYGVFILIFEFFYLLFYYRSKIVDIKKYFLAFFLVTLGFFPWLIKILELVSYMAEGSFIQWWIPKADIVFVVATIVIFCNSSLGNLLVFGFSLKNVFQLGRLKKYLNKSSFFEGLKRIKACFFDSSKFSTNFCATWILIPIILSLLISLLIQPISVTRYLILVSPGLYLLVAKGLTKIKLKIQYILFLILLIDSALISYSYYTSFNKEQWRQTATYVQEREDTQDLIIINAPWLESNFKHYYRGNNNITGVQTINQLNEALQKTEHQKLWLILSHDRFSDPNGEVKKALDNTYQLNLETQFISQDLLNNLSILGYPINPQAYYKIIIQYYSK